MATARVGKYSYLDNSGAKDSGDVLTMGRQSAVVVVAEGSVIAIRGETVTVVVAALGWTVR